MTGEALLLATTTERPKDDAAVRLGALFDAHQPRLFRLARRLAGSAEDARDLVQETFLRAARSPESVPDGSAHEEAWLVRVLINICRDRWRQVAVRRFHQPSLDLAPPSTHPESAFIAKSLVWRAARVRASSRHAAPGRSKGCPGRRVRASSRRREAFSRRSGRPEVWRSVDHEHQLHDGPRRDGCRGHVTIEREQQGAHRAAHGRTSEVGAVGTHTRLRQVPRSQVPDRSHPATDAHR